MYSHRWRQTWRLAVLFFVLAPSVGFGEPEHSTVRFSTGQPGVALEKPNTLLVALPIINTGTATATNVLVRSITLNSKRQIIPTKLPIKLGNVAVKKRAVLEFNCIWDFESMLRLEREFLDINQIQQAKNRELDLLASPAQSTKGRGPR